MRIQRMKKVLAIQRIGTNSFRLFLPKTAVERTTEMKKAKKKKNEKKMREYQK